jgi:hypothetical protein
MKQLSKQTLCYTCYGCSRLEGLIEGVYSCKDYVRVEKKEIEGEQIKI